ncbi:MAG: tetratricopeptide repeat protein [Clostridia bacterium]|nr:tetratricopeptide repeat protein [Clostridia bacterium]
MDENKEKELLEDGVKEIDTLSEQEKDEVSEILENLKKTKSDSETQPVTDWDGLAQVGGTDDEIVAETAAEESAESENAEADEEDISDVSEDELCISCGKRKRYTELDEDYLYCKVCREKMKKTPMNIWGILSLLATIVAAFIAIVWCGYGFSVAVPVIKGDSYMKDGNFRSALTCYQEALSMADSFNQTSTTGQADFDAGRKTYAKVVDAYYNLGGLVSAQDYLTYLEEMNALSSPRYSEANEYKKVLDSFADTCKSIQTEYQSLFMELSYAQGKKDISDIKKPLAEIEKLKADSKYDKYAVAYMQSYLCQFVENAEDAQVKYLLELKEGGKSYETIWAPQVCMVYLEQGKFDEVEKICNDIIKASPESVEFYQYLMKIQIKKNNPEKALEIYDKAEKTVDEIYYSTEPLTMPYTLLTEKAVCHALLGDKEKALSAIEESFLLNVDVHSANVYALLHYEYHVKGTKPSEKDGEKVYDSKDNGYDIVMSLFESNSIAVNEDVKAAMEGKKTLKEVFVDGEAYLQ